MESNENDISAKETFHSESSWIQSKNEHGRRKKSSRSQKSKRKKKIISVGRIYVAFSSIQNEEKADNLRTVEHIRSIRQCSFQNH